MPIYVESDDGPPGAGSAPPSEEVLDRIRQDIVALEKWLLTPKGQQWTETRRKALGDISLSGS